MKKYLTSVLFVWAVQLFSATVPFVVGFTYPTDATPNMGEDLTLTYTLTLQDQSTTSGTLTKTANGKASQLFVVPIQADEAVAQAVSISYKLTYTFNNTPRFLQSGEKAVCAVPFATHAKTIHSAINGFVMKRATSENGERPKFEVKADPSAQVDSSGTLTLSGAIGPLVPRDDEAEDAEDTLEVTTRKLTNVGELITAELSVQETHVEGEIDATGIQSEKWADNVFHTIDGRLNPQGTVPPGTIIAWFLEEDPGPDWVECTGLDGAPDLKGRFIRGGGHDTAQAVVDTDNITLSERHLPEHRHQVKIIAPHSTDWINEDKSYDFFDQAPKDDDDVWAEETRGATASSWLSMDDAPSEEAKSFSPGMPRRIVVRFFMKK